jgi:hypothetical protein
MVDITFDTENPLGSVTIRGTLVYGTEFNDTRFNQSSERMATGEFRVYDTGLNIVAGGLLMKNVSYAHGELLRTWIREKAVYMLNPFKISVKDCKGNPADADIGNGKGVDIVGAQLTTQRDKDILKYRAPGLYQVKFPYTYVRS